MAPGGNGFLSFEVSKGGRLESRSRHGKLLDWRGMPVHGAGRQDAEQVSFAREGSPWASPRTMVHVVPSSLSGLLERHAPAFPLMSPCLRNLMRRGGFGLRQGSGPPRCPASHDSNLTMS